MNFEIHVILSVIVLVVIGVIAIDGLRRKRQYRQVDRPEIGDLTILDLESERMPLTPTLSGSVPMAPTAASMIITLYVLPTPPHHFMGYELLQSIMAAGLEYGDMNIFHRKAEDGQGVRFSLASATEPGTFALENIGSLSCNGLVLFMRVDSSQPQPLETYQQLIQTAEQLALELDGLVYNDNRQPLTDVVKHAHQTQIRTLAKSLELA